MPSRPSSPNFQKNAEGRNKTTAGLNNWTSEPNWVIEDVNWGGARGGWSGNTSPPSRLAAGPSRDDLGPHVLRGSPPPHVPRPGPRLRLGGGRALLPLRWVVPGAASRRPRRSAGAWTSSSSARTRQRRLPITLSTPAAPFSSLCLWLCCCGLSICSRIGMNGFCRVTACIIT
jgi:hypothetical protein